MAVDHTRTTVRVLAVAALALAGCGSSVDTAASEDEGSGAPSSTSTETSGERPPEATTSGTTSSDESSTTGDVNPDDDGIGGDYETTGSCGFTCPPSGGGGGPGPGLECDIRTQDCPDGEKCAPWANDGGSQWNATRCVPLAASTGELGDACTFEGSTTSGIDSCGVGLWCGAPASDDPDANPGTCNVLCGLGRDCPTGQLCTGVGPLSVGFCSDACDPTLAEPCIEGWGCAPAGLGFACRPDGVQEQGAPCTSATECAGATACTDAPQCDEGESCCVALCDQTAPLCDIGQTCADYGSPLTAYEHVGVCNG